MNIEQRIADELGVKVKVIDIDVKRNRIALSMRLTEAAERKAPAPKKNAVKNKAQPHRSHPNKSQASKPKGFNKAPAGNSAMADAFAKLKN